MDAPRQNVARKPMTSPKQWNSGGGQHITSCAVMPDCAPAKRALLIIPLIIVRNGCPDHKRFPYKCVSIAALGVPVVPRPSVNIANELEQGLSSLPEVN